MSLKSLLNTLPLSVLFGMEDREKTLIRGGLETFLNNLPKRGKGINNYGLITLESSGGGRGVNYVAFVRIFADLKYIHVLVTN